MQTDDLDLIDRLYWSELCANCGYARRYHDNGIGQCQAIKDTGPVDCLAFEGDDPYGDGGDDDNN